MASNIYVKLLETNEVKLKNNFRDILFNLIFCRSSKIFLLLNSYRKASVGNFALLCLSSIFELSTESFCILKLWGRSPTFRRNDRDGI